jgi:hypothetical protein
MERVRGYLRVLLLGVVIALLLVGCGGGGGGGGDDNSLRCENSIEVPARPANSRADVFASTGIQVQDGDILSLSASGQWNVGLGPIGPDGDGGVCAGCPVGRSLGALIGRIGNNGIPFLVGAQTTLAAVGSGLLFLGANDNAAGLCDGSNAGSCYEDNAGTLQVCLTVEPGPAMTSTWDAGGGTLRIFRKGQLIGVYQRDTQPGVRTIANAFTELYAVGHPGDNLLRDNSPLVPPQILVGVGDAFISEACSNDPTSNSCDYFVHHDPTVEILQTVGSAVRFRVRTTGATQHNRLVPK